MYVHLFDVEIFVILYNTESCSYFCYIEEIHAV